MITTCGNLRECVGRKEVRIADERDEQYRVLGGDMTRQGRVKDDEGEFSPSILTVAESGGDVVGVACDASLDQLL
ncbi:MAG TPA: hypothetical protein VNT50_12090, partial [Microbacterium sp.]|uniref:hypothetical protein n=1 Tax=Microbacterium sp. TaxID=51671 RepID=UPI002CFF0248